MSSKNKNWLLIEWNDGGSEVIYEKSVINPTKMQLKVGDTITAFKKGKPRPAKLLARARGRQELDEKLQENKTAETRTQYKNYNESTSGSSWVPSDDGALSGDSDWISTKRIKLNKVKRKYYNRRSNKMVPKPMNKVNAVIPKSMEQTTSSACRKRTYKTDNKNLTADEFNNLALADLKVKSTITKDDATNKIAIDIKKLINIKKGFRVLYKIVKDLKRTVLSNNDIEIVEKIADLSEIDTMEPVIDHIVDENNESDEFNRSDDNVLITNKYENQRNNMVNENKNAVEDKEWIPIGSGKTLIHKDKFNKIKWKSYTIATRSLLLAVFPKKTLATHSLTGKRSPAFKDKPAKMCLDPKIISDVVIEIMDRYNVKENLVRGIITTKCADECKMWKTRNNKKKLKRSDNLENVPPEVNDALKHEP